MKVKRIFQWLGILDLVSWYMGVGKVEGWKNRLIPKSSMPDFQKKNYERRTTKGKKRFLFRAFGGVGGGGA